MQRIAMRDRTYERNMEVGYIEMLNEAYNEFFADYSLGPKLLTIDSNELDFVAHEEHLKLIENRIRGTLGMLPYQSELPLDAAD
jgi:deoxyguanosine kinase